MTDKFVKIRFRVKDDDTHHEIKRHQNIVNIIMPSEFEGKIVEIDLSELRNCQNLTILDLSLNLLKSVDLSPLSNCYRLEELDLSSNCLKRIDLGPLENCKSLKSLLLSENGDLESVILNPLKNCYYLEDLQLTYTGIKEINLEPLRKCLNLKILSLNENPLEELNLYPLSECKLLTELHLEKTLLTRLDISPAWRWQSLEYFTINFNRVELVADASLKNTKDPPHIITQILSHKIPIKWIPGLLSMDEETIKISSLFRSLVTFDDLETRKLRDLSHETACKRLIMWINKKLSENKVRFNIKLLQSMRDAGVDVLVTSSEQNKYGFQIKSFLDIQEKDFTMKVKAQLSDAEKHGLTHFWIVLCGDMTDKSQREKVRGLISEISIRKRSDIEIISPEQFVGILQEINQM